MLGELAARLVMYSAQPNGSGAIVQGISGTSPYPSGSRAVAGQWGESAICVLRSPPLQGFGLPPPKVLENLLNEKHHHQPPATGIVSTLSGVFPPSVVPMATPSWQTAIVSQR